MAKGTDCSMKPLCGSEAFNASSEGPGGATKTGKSKHRLPALAPWLKILVVMSGIVGVCLIGIARSRSTGNPISELSSGSSLSTEGRLQQRLPVAEPLILVVYYSRSGNTEKMAHAVAEGASQVGNVRVLIRKVTEVTAEELSAADAIALGCPTYFANIPGEMKQQLDLWNWKWRVDFTDKIGGAFATGGGQMGGKEHAMVSLLLFMLSNRMIVAGPLFEDETGEDIWGEPGAGAMTGPLDPGVSSGELDSARRLGQRLATLALRWKGTQPNQ